MVAAASTPATVTHTQITNTNAATSQPHSAATDHDAPRLRATATATTPPIAPTITRLATSPERSGGICVTADGRSDTECLLVLIASVPSCGSAAYRSQSTASIHESDR
jgi:hypothetical protein